MRLWTQDEFVTRRQAEWTALTDILTAGKPLHKLPAADISRFSALYRGACADLVHARDVGFTPDLVSYLDGLAGRAHNILYAAPPYRLGAAWDLVAREFPRTLRRNGRFFALGMALFFVPMIACAVATLFYPEFAYQVLSREQLQGMADMYSEGLAGRSESEDSGMAGFYVYNNVGIAFRCFATGILLGFGSLFFLLYNGVVMGTVLGHVIAAGHGHNILTFVCTHGTFELTAIAIAGGAGLQMGYALVDTGGRTRLGSLRAAGRDLAIIILGAAIMLCIAAALEAFWSPSAAPPPPSGPPPACSPSSSPSTSPSPAATAPPPPRPSAPAARASSEAAHEPPTARRSPTDNPRAPRRRPPMNHRPLVAAPPTIRELRVGGRP